MSLQSEMKELFEWISDLSADSKPAPQAVYRENWANVEDNLAKAVGHFEKAVAALKQEGSPLDEFARDLKGETEGLRLRAELLQRRAPRRPAKPPAEQLTELTERLAEKQKALDDIEEELREKKKELNQKKDVGTAQDVGAAPRKKEPKEPSDFVDLAARSLEWAHGDILEGIATPDAVANAFEKELDLVAEMALSLRLQLKAQEAEGSELKTQQEVGESGTGRSNAVDGGVVTAPESSAEESSAQKSKAQEPEK